jgi:hypothetical protein
VAHKNVLRWLDGRGWLVLSGGAGGAVRAQAIGRLAADGGVAYITLGSNADEGEQVLADMADLGAPSGYMVDILSEDDETIQSKLAQAGMVVIEAAADAAQMRSALMGAASDGIQIAFENGAIVLAEGSSAAAFGSWVLALDERIVTGLEWLEGALVVTGTSAVGASPDAQRVLRAQAEAIAVGIDDQSALALGPDGEVELWGDGQVTVALGRAYQS